MALYKITLTCDYFFFPSSLTRNYIVSTTNAANHTDRVSTGMRRRGKRARTVSQLVCMCFIATSGRLSLLLFFHLVNCSIPKCVMKDNENIITLRFISSHALYFSVCAQLRTYEATYRISKTILFNEAETKKQQQQPAC